MKSASKYEIQQQMLEEFVRAGGIDVAEWIRRHPEWQDEIVDYRIRLALVAGKDEPDETNERWEDRGILRDLIVQHCQTLALGEAWAQEEAVEENDEPEASRHSLAVLLCKVRSEPRGKLARKAFQRACVLTWTVVELKRNRGEASRLSVNKVTYLLEQSMNLGLFDHEQQRLGPYDRKIHYGAEPFAEREGYIRVVKKGGYDAFESGENATKALEYAPRYLRREDLARSLVEHLTTVTCNAFELEIWATVQWVARDLEAVGEEITPETVRAALRENPKWAGKLTRRNFRREVIQRALDDLTNLGLLPGC